MKKVLKTILMGAVAFSLAMGVGCGAGENSSPEKESSKAEDSSSQNKRDSFVTSLTTEKL